MEKPSPGSDGSRQLQCVGRLEVVKPKPVGFLCGSIPVPTDKAFHDFNSALVPSTETVRAPQYRMLPEMTDLNRLPLLSKVDKALPIAAAQMKNNGDLPWERGSLSSNLTRKGEALAVSGLVEYGDEIDVIAPTDILKQIFKIPYSRARLSVAVHRVGQTLVLNTGPDIEEGENLVRRHNNQSTVADQSLLLNFAMHSVRMEACDCPPAHHATSEEQPNPSSVLPGRFNSSEESSDFPWRGHKSQFFGQSNDIAKEEGFEHHSEFPQVKQDNIFWGSKKNKRNNGYNAVKKASHVKEKNRCSMQESEKYRTLGNEEFRRVLFWQFHNFRMLLGSDLLLFSNEKYVAVSLHLWDVSRQVTPLTWLEAWLDNVMASVPELAICYHQDGVVQGYELLKTDDIFLLKGISEDGTPAFHPDVVQQNGLAVLRFLQKNCKEDPGAYWLYKSAGEDAIQLFDLSVIPKNRASQDCDDKVPLPSLIHRGRTDSVLSLGTLLYRIAHRLSLSVSSSNKARCASFYKKCLDFLDEPDHLVVRASAHEQFARLLLMYDKELDLTSEALTIESEVSLVEAEEESFDFFSSNSESIAHEIVYYPIGEGVAEDSENGEISEDPRSEVSPTSSLNANISAYGTSRESCDAGSGNLGVEPSFGNERFAICELSTTAAPVVQTVADPISSKLAAVHHVSQAIKSLRWKRQLQSTETEMEGDIKTQDLPPSSVDFSVCACGDTDCIEVCDIREWLPTSKLDDKLWKLILLLGESYLALGQAFKDDGQLHQALKVVQLACLVYGSMPQHLEDMKFISSMVRGLPSQMEINNAGDVGTPYIGNAAKVKTCSDDDDDLPFERFSSTYPFWAKAWTLVGDVYVESNRINGKLLATQTEKKPSGRELRMSSEVLKEVKRLKKKLGQFNPNCNSCSLVNCSCQSDRASSGSSASSSTGNRRPLGYGRKQSKRLNVTSSPYSQDDSVSQKLETGKNTGSGGPKHTGSNNALKQTPNVPTVPTRNADGKEMHNIVSSEASQLETASENPTRAKNGGIFTYLGGPLVGGAEYNLSTAMSCYDEARKALGGYPSGSVELHSVVKKKGWVCNELGRTMLEKKELDKAEHAFADAINSFKEVLDYTNIILINCNLGHGRRALAEEMVLKIESIRKHQIFHDAYKQALETAKMEYRESLRYYGAAKAALNDIPEEAESVPCSLRDEVYTQVANTYLRLGMLLANEDTVAEIYDNRNSEGSNNPSIKRANKELRKHEISANDAIREALSLYESLGELRKQETAYAYCQLACYQRDCCLKFLEADLKKNYLSKGESAVFQRVKQYASLAERNWQKAIDFYGPKTHPMMYLTILMQRSALSSSLSSPFHSTTMLESALNRLLEGRHLSEATDSLRNESPQLFANFWSQLQMLLKNMLAMALSARSGDVAKLREIYKMSLKYSDFNQLEAMFGLWIS